MAYTKQTWENLPSQTTPINADRLTHIEDGIFNAAATADTAASDASSAISGLADKVDKVEGKGLSTNDFTDALKTKLDNIEAGAEVNVQSDWNQSDNSADDYIKNKPSLGTSAYKNSTSVVTDSSDLVESGAVYTALQGKADNSVIAPVENGTTASQAYTVGSHAIRNGAFITWKNAKAQGETINDASDYTSGAVGDFVTIKYFYGQKTVAANNYLNLIIPTITGYTPVHVTPAMQGAGASNTGYSKVVYDSTNNAISGVVYNNTDSSDHIWRLVIYVTYVKNIITVNVE